MGETGHYDIRTNSMWIFSTKHVARGQGSARMTEIHRANLNQPINTLNDKSFKPAITGHDFLNENT